MIISYLLTITFFWFSTFKKETKKDLFKINFFGNTQKSIYLNEL